MNLKTLKQIKLLHIGVLILLLTLVACNNKEETGAGSHSTVEFPDQESWNSTLIITRDGKKMGIVEASHFKKFNKRNISYISDGLKVDFFNENGQHTSVLESRGGEVDDNQQNMIAYGQVVVTSDSGITLYTDTLKWDNARQKIVSDIPVMIVSGTDTLFGDSFESDPSLENYQLTNSHGSGTELIRKPR